MPFALDGSPTNSELSDAVNYLLSNFSTGVTSDAVTGQINGPTGQVIGYLYQYMAVKYADSIDGTVNFSDSPTNRQFFGLRNTSSTVESTNPADYIFTKVTGGFGTTKFLYYRTIGGRQIEFVVSTTSPGDSFLQEAGVSIDLDFVTTVTAYNSAFPTIYQWTPSSTAPARPTTTSTYFWSTGVYTAPVGWSTVPTTDTTPGSFQWAITIGLVESVNVETSVLDWTNVAFPLYPFTSNGETGAPGTPGADGLSAQTAYRVQSQSAASPAGAFPQTTSGTNLPSGWTANLGTVSVGQVAWYSFGQYNGSTTTWDVPSAASIFQDIRSDNWNGSTPPVYGTPGTYGSAGYYIQRSTGDCYFNNGVFRADISTAGDAYFEGDNPTTVSISVNGTNYNIDYSAFGYGNTNASSSSVVRGGVYGYSNASTSSFNIGLIGNAPNSSKGFGVYGQGGQRGGFFYSSSSGGVAVEAKAFSSSNISLLMDGRLSWVYTWVVPNGSGSFLRDDGTWTSALVSAPTNSGTATVSSSQLSILGSTSTGIAGAYVGTTGSGSTVTLDVRTTSPSDIRLKEEVADVDLGLSFVNQLRPVSYKLIADPKHQKGYGFIADEVEQLIGAESSLVYEEPDWKVGDEVGFKTIHYPSYIAVLTKAIQELSAKVAVLEEKCKTLA